MRKITAILAAGEGSRMNKLTKGHPKSLLKIPRYRATGEATLIHRLTQQLDAVSDHVLWVVREQFREEFETERLGMPNPEKVSIIEPTNLESGFRGSFEAIMEAINDDDIASMIHSDLMFPWCASLLQGIQEAHETNRKLNLGVKPLDHIVWFQTTKETLSEQLEIDPEDKVQMGKLLAKYILKGDLGIKLIRDKLFNLNTPDDYLQMQEYVEKKMHI